MSLKFTAKRVVSAFGRLPVVSPVVRRRSVRAILEKVPGVRSLYATGWGEDPSIRSGSRHGHQRLCARRRPSGKRRSSGPCLLLCRIAAERLAHGTGNAAAGRLLHLRGPWLRQGTRAARGVRIRIPRHRWHRALAASRGDCSPQRRHRRSTLSGAAPRCVSRSAMPAPSPCRPEISLIHLACTILSDPYSSARS